MNLTPAAAARRLACCLILVAMGPAESEALATAPLSAVHGSVRLPDAAGRAIGQVRIVRTALNQAELAASMSFSVSLRMRAFPELESRIARGDLVPAAEMEASYLPLKSDYDRVEAWLRSDGFAVTIADPTHTSVFVRGSVADVARAFGISFARVAAFDGEYTSAVSEPQVPQALAPVILSVNGLQPEFRLRHFRTRSTQPLDIIGEMVGVTPDNLVSAYNIPKAATGSGQIIAVVGETTLAASDLTLFWNATNVSQSAGNYTMVPVADGPPNTMSGLDAEAALDVEWAGAIAPGAQLRYYVANNVFDCLPRIMADRASLPNLTVLSISFGDVESDQGGDGVLQALSQMFAQFSAAGVTVVASSGDSGSNPTPGVGAGGYSPTAPLGVNYPASDPNVTAVGGTTVTFTGQWTDSAEVVWDEIATGKSASGGGSSGFFPKASWQTGGTVLAGETMRCVPDVAALASGSLLNVNVGGGFLPESVASVGALIYVNGAVDGREGTSLACPIWAGIVALINQARTEAGQGPVGFLNPKLYPLQGSNAFNDITSGTNGAYSAGLGYDLCTGLGSPSVTNLIALLSGGVVPTHRLVNISTRAQVESGSNIVIAGFTIGGTGASKSVLVRAVGPGLTPFGVANALPQPVLSVFDSAGKLIASDTGWNNAPASGSSSVAANFRDATPSDMAATGAFALSAASADSALVLTLPPGSYTAQVSGSGGSDGIALAEVYEIDTSVPQVLTNISARCPVGTDSGVAISGFVVGGNQPEQVLIRGIGPGLGSFGLTGTLAQPVIAVFDASGTLIVSDQGWGSPLVSGPSVVASTFRNATAADMSAVGAFALAPGSKDSALVVTLSAGQYTVQVSGAQGTTGTALAEVYQVSNP